MAEVAIKPHTRRSKKGKTVQVRGYTRRVGVKGVHSPKRAKQGEEFEKIVNEMNQEQPKVTREMPKMTREQMLEQKKAYEEYLDSIRTGKQYSFSKRKMRESKNKKPQNDNKEKSTRRKENFFERMEDSLAKFVEKYGKKKYKRQWN